MTGLFKIRKDEIWAVIIALLVLAVLNAMMVWGMNYDLYTRCGKLGYWTIFHKGFRLSGFDSHTYVLLSTWRPLYSLYRHPLLALMMYPLSMLNSWLMDVTGMNCAIFIVAIINTVLYTYSFIFMLRTLREVIGINRTDSLLLSAMFYSFAYIMVAAIAPEHFGISMFLLLLTLYIAGRKMKDGTEMKTWHTMLLFFLASGVTLTNSVKIFMAQWFVNGRRFLTTRNILTAFALPTVILLGAYIYQDNTVMAEEHAKEQHILNERMKKDSVFAENIRKKQAEGRIMKSRQLADNEFMAWTDIELPRGKTLIENFFGETIQLHNRYLLEDVNGNRPVFVTYDRWQCYAVEAAVIALFVLGIYCGRRSRFLWLFMSWFTLDAFMHIVLGFGITEVYIMGPHWLFVIPLSIAYIFNTASPRMRSCLRGLVLFITVYLWVYNGSLLYHHFNF